MMSSKWTFVLVGAGMFVAGFGLRGEMTTSAAQAQGANRVFEIRTYAARAWQVRGDEGPLQRSYRPDDVSEVRNDIGRLLDWRRMPHFRETPWCTCLRTPAARQRRRTGMPLGRGLSGPRSGLRPKGWFD